MADDWQPGDLAMCIRDVWEDPRGNVVEGPARGSVNEVAAVDLCNCAGCGGALWLGFGKYLGGAPEYAAECFTKIRPLTEEEKREALEEIEQDRRVPVETN